MKKTDNVILPDVIICDCGSSEHQIIIHKYEDNKDKNITICLHLTTYRNVFKRIYIAIKYIFNYKCKYGAWDNIIISKQNYIPLKNAVEFIESE